jgi:hypothetical protein
LWKQHPDGRDVVNEWRADVQFTVSIADKFFPKRLHFSP